ncbi:hypothetical protein ACFP3Q_05570 [Nocardioides sp. GCM10027113]|uniref:hypothetical protein n=1 Tax=unclassified Nocardioides TaxID=2615069 RepID=UPI00361F713A
MRARREAEVRDLLLVARWADLQGTDPGEDPRPDPSLPRPPGGDRLVPVGGEGTPMVRELTLCELGIARGVHTLAARKAVADVLDLRHRLPQTWSLVLDLDAEPWLARKVATMCRHLPVAVVGVVDAAVADAIRTEAPSRVMAIAEAKVIEADPAGHAARIAAERERRYVALTRPDATGLRTIVARVTAGDAAWIDATVARVAEILAARPGHADTPVDDLRAEAAGWLARPAELTRLLLEGAEVPAEVGEEPDREAQGLEPDDTPCRALAFPADLLDALREVDLEKLRPRSVLYVHLHEAALTGMAQSVARVEGLGPLALAQLGDLLGHSRVTVKPVLDLAHHHSVNAYEHPEAIRERIHLIRPGDAFPHASAVSRNTDLDHPVAFDPHGPPGQTSCRTSQPLGRRGHRAKTHLGYTATPAAAGTTIWRTPHGLHRRVDGSGTHHLDPPDDQAVTHTDDIDRVLELLLGAA